MMWRILLLFCSIAIGCGAKSGLGGRVDFSYKMAGEMRRISNYNGRPTMLVLMRTSEVVSQIYIQHVKSVFEATAGRVVIIVLTVESSEAPFVEQYAAFEKLPFDIGVAESSVLHGQSSLGVVPGIPTTYFINEKGDIVEVVSGVIEKNVLMEKVERIAL